MTGWVRSRDAATSFDPSPLVVIITESRVAGCHGCACVAMSISLAQHAYAGVSMAPGSAAGFRPPTRRPAALRLLRKWISPDTPRIVASTATIVTCGRREEKAHFLLPTRRAAAWGLEMTEGGPSRLLQVRAEPATVLEPLPVRAPGSPRPYSCCSAWKTRTVFLPDCLAQYRAWSDRLVISSGFVSAP
jgi:hypothetical protein